MIRIIETNRVVDFNHAETWILAQKYLLKWFDSVHLQHANPSESIELTIVS